MKIEDRVIKLLIEAFTEECLEEIDRMKHPETDQFNFGLGSADAAVRRVKTKWVTKLTKNIKEENDVNSKVF